METRVMTAHVPVPLAERVDALAEQLERSRGWIIKEALAAWVDEEECYLDTLQALREVDAEGAISDDVARAYLRSLGTEHPLPLPSSQR